MAGNVEAAKGVGMEKGRTSTIKNGDNSNDMKQWTIYVIGTSNEHRSGADMMLIGLKGTRSIVHYFLGSRHQTIRPNTRPSS